MAADQILRSFGDVSIKTDVVGVVELLTAVESWFLNNLGKTTATNVIHSTQVDTLRTAAANAIEEGADLTALANSTPTLLTNLVQKIGIPFKVSRTAQLVQRYSGENELARQTMKALKDWGKDAEFNVVRSTLVSGVSGTATAMAGIVQAISKSSNTTAHASGTALSASIINGLMKTAMDNSNGDVATDLFMGSFLRNVVDGFTQKSNTLVTVNASTINNMVDYYQTSFGRIALHYHRYVHQSGDATGRILAVRPETLKIAYLRRPFVDTELARTADADFRAVLGDLTLEVKNQDSNWWASGLDID